MRARGARGLGSRQNSLPVDRSSCAVVRRRFWRPKRHKSAAPPRAGMPRVVAHRLCAGRCERGPAPRQEGNLKLSCGRRPQEDRGLIVVNIYSSLSSKTSWADIAPLRRRAVGVRGFTSPVDAVESTDARCTKARGAARSYRRHGRKQASRWGSPRVVNVVVVVLLEDFLQVNCFTRAACK